MPGFMKKQLHKQIGQGVKKYQRQFTKYLYERDTIFATVWVFLFIIILGSIPLNLGNLNPIKLSLKDFDFNDMGYSNLNVRNDSLHQKIILINIGEADREDLSLLIDKAASFSPKIMGLDVLLSAAKDPAKDSLLSATIARHSNLVLATRLDWNDTAVPYKKNYFSPVGKREGYVNMLGEDWSTIRLWSPVFENESRGRKKGDFYKSFSASVVEGYDSTAFKKLMKRGNKTEIINYTRRVNRFYVIQPDQLMTDAVDSSTIKDKIVLFGYINDNPNNIEDKKFTPMNSKFYGKTVPDMNGIVVHANMIAMAIENNYIKTVPSWLNWVIAIFVCWLHMSFFIRYYLESHIWFHLIAKIAQVASAILFVWLGIYLFTEYRLKVDMKLSLLVIVLAVDVIYFYEAWATWMNKRYQYKTIFKSHHH